MVWMDARMPAALLALSFWFWRAAVAASVTGLGVAALGAGWTSGTLGLEEPPNPICPPWG